MIFAGLAVSVLIVLTVMKDQSIHGDVPRYTPSGHFAETASSSFDDSGNSGIRTGAYFQIYSIHTY